MKNELQNVEGIKKRTATVFFIIDKSGSMGGTKIGSVNHAMGESIPEMCKLVEDSADAKLNIAVLTFANEATWITPTPLDINEFHWNNIDVESTTNFGVALKSLGEKLNRSTGFMKEASESFAPAFILMSDGQPTDNYKSYLDKLNNNGWFKNGTKTAIAIGNDADKQMLAEFTGNIESVIEVHNAKDLAKVIKFVSIASSQIVTKGSSMQTNGVNVADNGTPIITVPDDLCDNYNDF